MGLAWACVVPEALAQVAIPELQDARELRPELPLVLLVEIEQCAYCDQVKQDFLLPLRASNDWKERGQMYRIDLQSHAPFIDFDGAITTHSDWALAHGFDFAPIVLVLDPVSGQPLAEGQVGLTTPDFYGYYLERNIDQATAKLGQQAGQ